MTAVACRTDRVCLSCMDDRSLICHFPLLFLAITKLMGAAREAQEIGVKVCSGWHGFRVGSNLCLSKSGGNELEMKLNIKLKIQAEASQCHSRQQVFLL